ncbi:Uncharacterised protein [Rhodococcus gordoniae]|uniref:Uncharacterized protein n=1 Tax=Rhodococcus gordoniae TaxID=223392 RepID=A0A379LW86_9NOCA|nr:Uncharacterised protein [Rhodococcus gordoniae]
MGLTPYMPARTCCTRSGYATRPAVVRSVRLRGE